MISKYGLKNKQRRKRNKFFEAPGGLSNRDFLKMKFADDFDSNFKSYDQEEPSQSQDIMSIGSQAPETGRAMLNDTDLDPNLKFTQL